MATMRLRFPTRSILLDRLVTERDKAGIWEFHRSASTYYDGKQLLRHIAVIPAEPKHGTTAHAYVCSPRGERDSWIDLGTAEVSILQD